jgi:hypothetical protein
VQAYPTESFAAISGLHPCPTQSLWAGGAALDLNFRVLGPSLFCEACGFFSSSSGTNIFTYDADNLIDETKRAGAMIGRYTQTENIDTRGRAA